MLVLSHSIKTARILEILLYIWNAKYYIIICYIIILCWLFACWVISSSLIRWWCDGQACCPLMRWPTPSLCRRRPGSHWQGNSRKPIGKIFHPTGITTEFTGKLHESSGVMTRSHLFKLINTQTGTLRAPATPTAASLFLPTKLIILLYTCGENPAKKISKEINPRKLCSFS